MMAGDEEVEAVARALTDCPDEWDEQAEGDKDVFRGMAAGAIAALDRVRSRPAGGTQGEDHEADWLREAIEEHRDGYRADHELWAVIEPGGFAHRLSPADGTEPDTAKLVEALTRIERLKDKWSAPLSHPVGDMRDPAYAGVAAWAAVGSEAHKIAVDALAGFSVDAGKAEEER